MAVEVNNKGLRRLSSTERAIYGALGYILNTKAFILLGLVVLALYMAASMVLAVIANFWGIVAVFFLMLIVVGFLMPGGSSSNSFLWGYMLGRGDRD